MLLACYPMIRNKVWGAKRPPKEGMKEMKDWNDEQRKAMIDINDLPQIKNNSDLKDLWLDLQSENKRRMDGEGTDNFKQYTDEGCEKDNISVEVGKNGRVFLNPYDYIKNANNKMPETKLTIGYFKK